MHNLASSHSRPSLLNNSDLKKKQKKHSTIHLRIYNQISLRSTSILAQVLVVVYFIR